VVVETYPERYANSQGFAREVNLPLLGTARLKPVPVGAGLAQLLEASSSSSALAPVVDGLTETRRSLTLRSLLVAGFAHDPECFAVGLSIAREWSRRGLRIAVVDLDFWNPSISRPPSHPNEGLVDVLEYGCSFGRVAWEVVADRLWMIGPGSHPPDETRIAEHSDWPRAGRVLASRVDVALYVAPLLDRRGFTGKLSKKMDAVILTASMERIDRTNLRDAFLELWGSDAPMIGCVGIEPVEVKPAPVAVGAHSGPGGAPARASAAAAAPPTPTRAALPPAPARTQPSTPSRASTPAPSPPSRGSSPAPAPPPRASSPAPAPPPRASSPAQAPPTPSRAPATAPPSRSAAAPPPSRPAAAPSPSRPAPSPTGPRSIPAAGPATGLPPSVLKSGAFEDDWTEPAVVAALERDVIGGIVEPEPKKSRAWIWVVIISLILGAVVAAILVTRNAPPRGSVQAQQPAGEEPITPSSGASGDEAAGSAAPGSPSPDPPAPGVASPGTASPGMAPPAASNPGATSRPGIASDDALPFRVHVASFRTESKVDEVVQVLRRRNLDAWFEPPPKGGTWYRIYIGHFATEKEARDYAAWLLKNGFVESAQTYPQ
jgi:hypothetical protein